jgi:hypothetical protein
MMVNVVKGVVNKTRLVDTDFFKNIPVKATPKFLESGDKVVGYFEKVSQIPMVGVETSVGVVKDILLDHVLLEAKGISYTMSLREFEEITSKVINIIGVFKNGRPTKKDHVKRAVVRFITRNKSVVFPEIEHKQGLTANNMFDVSRDRDKVYSRNLYAYIRRSTNKLSLQTIGNEMKGSGAKGKDHATILHGIKNVDRELETNKHLRARFQDLIDESIRTTDFNYQFLHNFNTCMI